MSARPPVRRTFRPIRGRGLRKLLWKRLRIPRSIVHPALRAAKVAVNPGQVRLRRELARELRTTSGAGGEIPWAKGWLPVAPGQIPGSESVVARCAQIFGEKREVASVDDHIFNPRKEFLLALLSGADFCGYPELLRFMISRSILDTATLYLGAVPLLAGAALWWSPVSDTALRSQLFHLDGEDESQVKLILNIFDTDEENGPFALLPADASEPLRVAGSFRRRIPDEEVESRCGLANLQQLVGPAGSGAFVDTSRCLHYGSRGTRRERLVLMIQFLRFECPTESTFDFQVPPTLLGADLDPFQKLALGLQ